MKIRFQADANVDSDIGLGLKRREPSVNYRLGMSVIPDGLPDPDVLLLAAEDERVLVTSDVRTMPKHFANFIKIRESPGIILIARKNPDWRSYRMPPRMLAILDSDGNPKSDQVVTTLIMLS